MENLFKIALVLHIAAGSLAVLVGLIPLVTSKGEKLHRSFGGWFRRTMYLVIGTAALMTMIAMKPYFAALTAAAAIGCFSGLRVLKRKRPDLDIAQRAQPLDWVFTVGVLLISAYLALAASAGEVGNNATVFYALIGAAAFYSAYDLLRFTFPTAWPFFPRLWFYEHLVKMLGSYSAVVAAFSGSVLYFLPIPEPWKQLWSAILFHNLMIAFILWYAIKGRRAARAALT
jgi:uncharacterized membrane protein YuzA (DUF378 family)